MELVDCRRLTGPSIVSDAPCAVVEAELAVEETEPVVAEWTRQARRMLDATGWSEATTSAHRLNGGVMLVLSAPADGLYAATEIAEWAWQATRAAREGDEPPDFDADADSFRRVIAEESNPALIALATAAGAHDVIFLADEERISVGLGTGVRSWPTRALPDAADVPWKGVHDIPIALIGGSHGKTSCVRLAAAIVNAAGKRAGYSTNAALTIGDEVIERGDCADAESARDLLRERRLQVALLETPREELWHRGLPVPRATAALITGLTEQPSAELGARSAEEMADVTWLVTRALGPTQPLVLNAEDPALAARATRARSPLVWYGVNPELPALAAQIERGAVVWTVRDGMLGHQRGRQWRGVAPVADPTRDSAAGAPAHELSNALAAAALAHALGMPERAIAAGLHARELTQAKAGIRA
jgi:hypothetical protein